MNSVRHTPGPDADRAFRLGIAVGAIIGLGVVGLLYWHGTLPLFAAGYAVAFLFPIYLVLVAIALSVWLGYDKDATALRPVHRTER
ncbi:MAG: hypothetical protein ABEK02_08770 [Haloquadratum sp.]